MLQRGLVVLGDVRDFELEHEQRDHDRKHCVAEKHDTLKT